MQWRLLQRRGPSRSFTIVGDIAQAAAASAAETWERALSPLVGSSPGEDRLRREELTVNYRTPGLIATAAESMAIAHGLPVTLASSVRPGEFPLEVVTDIIQATRLALEVPGTIAVIAVEADISRVTDSLQQVFGARVGHGSDALTSDIAVMTAQEAKGLEFDSVVIVEPSRVVAANSRGAAALYVAMTRPTQRLIMVSTEALPDGLDLPENL